jgi:hypothetical protein
MPLDTTNPPFRRPLTGGELGTLIGSRPELDQSLKIESLLLEEYNYASVTAYQALEDRARMFNLYLLLFGVVASGLGAVYQFGGPTSNTGSNFIQALIVTLLIVGGLLGFAFFVKLIRLRQAYRESLICMNLIKEFYIQQFQKQMPQITRAFRWRLKTIPAGERFGSVTFAAGQFMLRGSGAGDIRRRKRKCERFSAASYWRSHQFCLCHVRYHCHRRTAIPYHLLPPNA